LRVQKQAHREEGVAETKNMAGKKVIIEVKTGKHYCPTVKNGKEYTSVSCMSSLYGSSSPCDNENEVQHAINNCKNVIREYGDIPKVEDNRMTLNRFF